MLINERLVQDIRKIETKLNSEGKLYSRSQLKDFYETFRKQFGPDKLKVLDGELLLDTLHNYSNRDSLAYWLEFKMMKYSPTYLATLQGAVP